MHQASVLDREFEWLLIQHKAWDCLKSILELRWVACHRQKQKIIDQKIAFLDDYLSRQSASNAAREMIQGLQPVLKKALGEISKEWNDEIIVRTKDKREFSAELLSSKIRAQQVSIVDEILKACAQSSAGDINAWTERMENLAADKVASYKLFFLCSPTGDGFLHRALFVKFNGTKGNPGGGILSSYVRTLGNGRVEEVAEKVASELVTRTKRAHVIAAILEKTPPAMPWAFVNACARYEALRFSYQTHHNWEVPINLEATDADGEPIPHLSEIIPSSEPDSFEMAMNEETGRHLGECMKSLTPRERAVLLMRGSEKLEFEEIARELGGIKRNYAYQIYLRARTKMKKCLEKFNDTNKP